MSRVFQRQPREHESFAAQGFSDYDVIHPRIDVSAQKALIRLRGNPATASDAAGMLYAVKSEQLQGIYGDDLRAAAQLAARRGTVRWELVPRGQVAALVPEYNPYAPPTIIFRTQYRGNAARLDPALVAAYRSFLGGLYSSALGEGEAFAQPRVGVSAEGEVLGGDNRTLVNNTLAVPFRFVCSIQTEFVNPAKTVQVNEQGSGTLISNRHVLTAAHVLLGDQTRHNATLTRERKPTFPPGFIEAENIMVVPARTWDAPNASSNTPVGASGARKINFPPQWRAAAAGHTVARLEQFDYALITLERDLGLEVPFSFSLSPDPLGFWGHKQLGPGTRIIPRVPNEIRNLPVYHAGYPLDKCRRGPQGRPASEDTLNRCTGSDPIYGLRDRGSTQWEVAGRILDPAPADMPGMLVYDCDTANGQSGGPVWLYWNGYRNLIAINTGGRPRPTGSPDIIANMGVRITEPILQQLRAWMNADGVTASF